MIQFESLAGFSAVIDRLGQFQEVMGRQKHPHGTRPLLNGADATDGAAAASGAASTATPPQTDPSTPISIPVAGNGAISVTTSTSSYDEDSTLLARIDKLTVFTPDRNTTLVRDLCVEVGSHMDFALVFVETALVDQSNLEYPETLHAFSC